MSKTPARWLLSDLAANGDLAQEYGVGRATIVNWTNRYNDFPAPLLVLSTGPGCTRGDRSALGTTLVSGFRASTSLDSNSNACAILA
jgi:hypothetical protein